MSNPMNAKTIFQKSRQALERYLFYCNRYMNHAQSAKFETKVGVVQERLFTHHG